MENLVMPLQLSCKHILAVYALFSIFAAWANFTFYKWHDYQVIITNYQDIGFGTVCNSCSDFQGYC